MCVHCTIRDIELHNYRRSRGARIAVRPETLVLLAQEFRGRLNRTLLRSGNARRAVVRRHVRRHHRLSCQGAQAAPRLTG